MSILDDVKIFKQFFKVLAISDCSVEKHTFSLSVPQIIFYPWFTFRVIHHSIGMHCRAESKVESIGDSFDAVSFFSTDKFFLQILIFVIAAGELKVGHE